MQFNDIESPDKDEHSPTHEPPTYGCSSAEGQVDMSDLQCSISPTSATEPDEHNPSEGRRIDRARERQCGADDGAT